MLAALNFTVCAPVCLMHAIPQYATTNATITCTPSSSGAWPGTLHHSAVVKGVTCPVQPAWGGAATWQGEVCSGSNTTAWLRVSCQGGRVTAVNLNGLGASGPLEGFGALTALTELRLAYNRFSGAWKPRARAQAAALVSGLLRPQLGPRVKRG